MSDIQVITKVVKANLEKYLNEPKIQAFVKALNEKWIELGKDINPENIDKMIDGLWHQFKEEAPKETIKHVVKEIKKKFDDKDSK